jgi:hypothetical protein
MDPAHRQERMAEAKATYRVISRCLCLAFCAAEETAVEELVEELSWRRSGVRVEAIAAAGGKKPFQIEGIL